MAEANKIKQRKCHSCDTQFTVDALTLRRHSRLCSEGADQKKRLEALGLVAPEPKLTIKKIIDPNE